MFKRVIVVFTSVLLLVIVFATCGNTEKQLTVRVEDKAGNPQADVQVNYGISNPETFETVGFTDENGLIVWSDPPTGKQDLYLWRVESSGRLSNVLYLPRKISRSDFGSVITVQVDWTTGDIAEKT